MKQRTSSKLSKALALMVLVSSGAFLNGCTAGANPFAALFGQAPGTGGLPTAGTGTASPVDVLNKLAPVTKKAPGPGVANDGLADALKLATDDSWVAQKQDPSMDIGQWNDPNFVKNFMGPAASGAEKPPCIDNPAQKKWCI